MKVLVTGAAGMLGQAVVAEFGRRDADVAPFSRADLDIAELGRMLEILRAVRPDIVVNCAAYTDVDGAESNREEAFRINGLGVRNLALACRETRAGIVHISTDYVFNGDKEKSYGVYDHRYPVNAYGETKLWGEKVLAGLLDCCYLVRTSWLFGPGGRNFVSTIRDLGREALSAGRALRVVDDQRGSPTYTVDLARAIADLVLTGCYGTYHMTNQGVTTWYRFALRIFEVAGIPVDMTPVATSDFPRPARRPRNSTLDPFPLEETIGYLLPTWEDALQRYLGSLTAISAGSAGVGVS